MTKTIKDKASVVASKSDTRIFGDHHYNVTIYYLIAQDGFVISVSPIDYTKARAGDEWSGRLSKWK